MATALCIRLHPNAKDLSGMTFGDLTAIAPVRRAGSRHLYWLCTCKCGAKCIFRGNYLMANRCSQCGCKSRRGGRNSLQFRRWTVRTRRCWCQMMQRCYNRKHAQYKDYGGRGIRVCDRWKIFDCFVDDMGNAPRGLTLDRIDNDAGYSPANCRWATRSQQARNTRRTRYITCNGKTLCLCDWAHFLGIPLHRLRYRTDRYGEQQGVSFFLAR